MRGVVCVALLLGLGSRAVADPAPKLPSFDKPFAATAAELTAAAKAAATAAKPDAPVVVLWSSHLVAFDATLRRTQTTRIIYLVRDAAKAAQWGGIDGDFDPAFQEPTRFRARTLSANGAFTALDPATLAIEPRAVHGKVPAYATGAIVEEERVITEREPEIGAALVSSFDLGDADGAARERLAIDAPANLIHAAAHALPASVVATHAIANGRETWTWRVDDRRGWPAAPSEDHDSDDSFAEPTIELWAGASWPSAIAVVEARVARSIAGTLPLPAELPRATTLAGIRAIAAWWRGAVADDAGATGAWRHTAAETLVAKQAGTYDRAVLLLAALRQLGGRAELVAIPYGAWDPARIGVPLGAHWIVRVHVDGADDVWVDADEDLDGLSTRHRGRHAIAIRSDATAPFVVPVLPASESSTVDRRTLVLPERGLATLELETTIRGAWAFRFRQYLGDGVASRRKLQDEYPQGTVTRYQIASDPVVTETATVRDVGWAHADDDGARIGLAPSLVLDSVPRELRHGTSPFVHDFVWRAPHTHDLIYRVTIPTGFGAPVLTPTPPRALGTLTLTTTGRIDGDVVEITYHLDTGRARLTPAEATATRTALVAFLREPDGVLVLPNLAAARLAARDAIGAKAELDRLIALHPREALHHEVLAAFLLDLGLGDAARREARAAIALEPNRARAHLALARALARDRFGAPFGPSRDRDGAIAEARRAVALAPKDLEAARVLATLLAHDRDGRERLDAQPEAIAAWRVASALAPDDPEVTRELLVVLMRAHAPDLEKVARESAASDTRTIAIVIALARTRGCTGAIGYLAADGAGQLARLGHPVVAELLREGDYDLATACGREPGVGGVPPDLAGLAHTPALGTTTGEDVARALLDASLGGGEVDAFEPEAGWSYLGALHRGLAPSAAVSQHLTPSSVLRDMAAAMYAIKVEGAPAGPWRVTIDFVRGGSFHLFAARDGKVAKLVALVGAPEKAAAYLRRVGPRSADARTMIEWLVADLPTAPFAEVWGGDPSHRPETVELVTALLSAATDHELEVLARCPSTVPAAALACDAARGATLARRGAWKELESHAIAWARHPDALHRGEIAHVIALVGLRRLDEAERELVPLKAVGGELAVVIRGLQAAIALGRRHVDDALAAVPTDASASTSDLNEAAWLLVTEAHDLDRANALAERLKNEREPKIEDTRAVVAVERGDLALAAELVERWRFDSGRAEPADAAQYVRGRIAERLGLRDDAIAAYRAVHDTPAPIIRGPFDLARERLAALGAKP